MRITIKTTLVSLFCLMSLIVAALCAVSLKSSLWAFTAAREAATLSQIDRNLYQGLAYFRSERGEAGVSLALGSDRNQRNIANMNAFRAKMNEGTDATLKALDADSLSDPRAGALLRDLRSQYESMKTVRQQVDAQLALPLASRDPAPGQRMVTEGARLLTTLEQLSNAVEADIRTLDPSLSQLILARSMGWATRTYVGIGTLLINAAVSQDRPLTAAEARSLLANDARADVAWAAVTEIATAANAPAILRDAAQKAEDFYFKGSFKQLRDAIVAKVTAGEKSGVSVPQWREPIEVALFNFNEVSGAAVESLETAANHNEAGARNTAIVYAVVLLFSIAAAVFGLVVVIHRVVRPMTRLTGVMQDVAGGDLAVEVPDTARQDEIGAMAKTLLVFKDSLARNAQMERDAQEARVVAEAQRRQSMHALADQFEAAVGSIVGGVSEASGTLYETARQMSDAAEKTSSQSTAVAAAAEQASTNVVMVASSAEELGASVDEISRQVSQSSQLSASAVAEASRTGEVMRDLSQAASRIGDVVQLINTIASQTNLLALNATIEAARAGDAGKGFAVVASEVKELATQTGKATEEIASQIGAIQSTTQEAVKVIEGVSQQIRQMSDVATGISAAVEEQGIATREIVRNVDQAASGTSTVTTHISDVARTAHETGTSAGQVLDASSTLTDQARRLEEEMRRFLDTVRAA
ncbi:methyl-accepting chemotaxis protein [Azorhizobium oxalatiphilum]|uniref:Methyl-accepting chemotaxis protein n=1 Tax=Azorhizobium oxalatiphilum TaxID=980631 RepID=A0A917CE69_9HYPH|nr:methyl-accepting chemotaxis protein [Azorhizobium oxalatiphilum]GGF86127.1 methyl-accepting chemotaxis protein [Azorhizobium oxalatiphilum]